MKRFESSRYAIIISIVILMAVGILIYSNTYRCSWHFDDLSYIVNNPTIRTLTDVRSIWERLTAPGRTVVLYTFALNYHFGKTDVFGYHVVNNAIHLITTLLVYWMCLQLFHAPRIKNSPLSSRKRILSLFIALVFLTHPLQTQAVTYICQRFASLATLFYVAAMSFYLRARLEKRGALPFFLLSAVAALFGMFSKQITITLPVSVLLTEWLFFSKTDQWKRMLNWKILIPVLLFLLIIPALYSFNVKGMLSITHKSSGSHHGDLVNAYYYPLTQLRVIPTYLRLLIFPIGQNLLVDFPTSKSFFEWKTSGGFFLIILILAIGYRLRKKRTFLAFGVFWFFLTISVESSFIPIRHVIFEHRVYLPSVGFSIFIVCAIYFLIKEQKRLVVSLSVIVLTFSFLTYQRNKVWRDEFTLWADVKEKSPGEMRAYLNTGIAYSEIGKYDQAIEEFNRALDIYPRSVMTLNNKGIVYTRQHLFDLAILEYNKALEIDQNWAEIWNNRGDAFRHKAEYQLALENYNKALEINPQLYKAFSNRGVVYSHLGRNDLALSDFNHAIQIDPDFIEAYQNRGNLYGLIKEYKLAVKDFSKVIEANAGIPQVYNNRGNAFRHLGEYKSAFADYNKALEIDPNFFEGYNNRGVIYRQWNKTDLALNDYNKAIMLSPDYVKAYNNRGNLFKQQGRYNQALEDFNTALDIDPNNKIVYFNRAQTLIGKGDFVNAMKDAQKSNMLGLPQAEKLIEQLNKNVDGR
ncbi:MAG: tetratricopeptide repeat protein [Candidatus Omnitrophota bacterium]